MLVSQMLILVGELLNNPAEDRFDKDVKLRRLNLLQQELTDTLPPESLIGLPEIEIKFEPQSPISDRIDLPLDFLYPISVRGDQTPVKFLPPGSPTTFPYAGTTAEPVIRQKGQYGVFYGRSHDQTIWLSYYRMPRELKVVGVEDLSGNTHTGDDWECELPKSVHHRLVYGTVKSFRISDAEIIEQQGD